MFLKANAHCFPASAQDGEGVHVCVCVRGGGVEGPMQEDPHQVSHFKFWGTHL